MAGLQFIIAVRKRVAPPIYISNAGFLIDTEILEIELKIVLYSANALFDDLSLEFQISLLLYHVFSYKSVYLTRFKFLQSVSKVDIFSPTNNRV